MQEFDPQDYYNYDGKFSEYYVFRGVEVFMPNYNTHKNFHNFCKITGSSTSARSQRLNTEK